MQNAVWMPWIGRNRPATPVEEAAFVDALAVRARGRSAEIRRPDVTAVLNALRCGLSVDDLWARAPGLHPARLYAAYCDLERRRIDAATAWTSIAIAGRLDVYRKHRAEAAKLVPAMVTRLGEVAVAGSPDEFDRAVLQLAAAVASTAAAVGRIERVIESSPPDSRRAVELGRVLYDPLDSGMTGRPDFLAHRVGALVPARVAALLEESTIDTEACTEACTGARRR